MDDIGFTVAGRQIEEAVENAWSEVWVYRHTSSHDGSISIRAGKDIPKGSPLFLEAPLFSVNEASHENIYTEYLYVNWQDRKAWYRDLSYDLGLKKSILSDITNDFREHPDEVAECMQLPALYPDAAQQIAIFARHAVERPGSGTRDMLRMMNWMQHSCKPNAVLAYNSVRSVWTVYSIVDIDEGDQITRSYVGPTLAFAQRTEALATKGVEPCLCDVCTQERQVQVKDAGYTTPAEHARCELERLSHVISTTTHSSREELIPTYEQMLKVLASRPEFIEYQCEIYKTLGDIYAEQGDYDQANTRMSKAIELSTTCYGADGVETLSLIELNDTLKNMQESS